MKTTIPALAAIFAVAFAHLAHARTHETPGVAAQPDTYFYTGKPYDSDLEAYTFAFRNYDAGINRWTSVDPAGFPDGANGHFYAPVPTRSLDPFGLMAFTFDEGAPSAPYAGSYNGTKFTITMKTVASIANNSSAVDLINAHYGDTYQAISGGSLNNASITISTYGGVLADRTLGEASA